MGLTNFFKRNVSQTSIDQLSLIYPKNKSTTVSYGSLRTDLNDDSRLSQRKNSNEVNENEELDTKPGVSGLFRYASNGDKLLMFIGLIFSIVHGASFPVLALVFGQMTNTFIIQATQGFSSSNVDNKTYLFPPSRFQSSDIFNDFSTDTDDAYFQMQVDSLATTTAIPSSFNNSSSVSKEALGMTADEFTAYMGRFAMYYLCIGLGVLVTSFLQTICWELAAERQVQRLRTIYFDQVLRQDISWYDLRTKQSGDLTTKLADDLERIREGIGSKFSMVTQYISTFISGIIVGLIANWHLTCAILIIGPVLIGTSAYLALSTTGHAAREQLKYSLAGAVAEEVLNSIRTVAAFGGEIKEINRYSMALEEGRRMAMKKYYVMAAGAAIVFFIMYGAFGLAFWYGAELISDGRSTPGSVFTVFFSVLAGAFSIGNALPFVNAVSTAVGAASTIFGVIDRVPDIDPYSKDGFIPDANRQITSNSVKGHIEFKDVCFSYPARPDVQVLKGLSLQIEPGKTVVLVGTSGAGKSTVVSLLLKFYKPASGEIILDGIPLNDYNLSWLRNQIGVVSQEPVLFGASIEDNIRFGYTSDDKEVTTVDIIKAATLANAHRFITALPNGYATMVGDHGAQLSGGQKQRIAIARAIVRDPKILLLDEATSALDSHSEGIVQDALERAMEGRTTVIIAHRLSTIRNADAIYVLKDGSVGEVGTHNELMLKQGLYYNLVTAQTYNASEDSEDCEDDNRLKTAEKSKETKDLSKIKKQSLPAKSSDTMLKDRYDRPDEDYYTRNELDFDEKNSDAIGKGSHGSLMWNLLKLNAPEWGWLLFGMLGCTVAGITMPTFAFFYGEIFSTFTLIGDELKSAALFWTAMFFVLASTTAISYFTQIICITMASEKLVARIRLLTFQNILKQSVGWFDIEINSPGRLISRLARDAPMIKHAAGLRTGHTISATVTLLAALCIAFIYGWKLACLLIIGVPLIIGASYHQALIIKRNEVRDLKLMDNAGRVATECVSNIRTVHSLNKQKLFLNLYTDYLELPFREAKRQAVVYAIVFSLSQAIIFIMYAAAFRFGAYLIEIGDMTPTDVYRVFFALAFCAAAVGQTFAYVKDYHKAKLAAECLFKLIENKSRINIDSPTGIKPVIHGKVTFDSVYFKYPSRPDVTILKGISFSVEPGKTLALVGSSGCGKSTIVSLLERFYDPYQGQVMIDDFDIRSINVRYLRSNIGLVTQEPVLFDSSIKDNILYGIEDNQAVTMGDVIKATKAANIHNFIISLPQGYDTPVGGGGCKLSGGQKQRIAIARALIRDPKILLLDEATSALDTESEKVVQEALDHARQGRTCIIIAHRLSTIQNADWIAVMHHGIITEQGTHEELKNKRQRYYQLIKRQNL